jgi:macrolide transport system ATP-binding/permease protein
LDKFIKIDRLNFKVIGILPMKGSSPFRDQDDVALIPLKTAMKRTLGTLYYNTFPPNVTPRKIFPKSWKTPGD